LKSVNIIKGRGDSKVMGEIKERRKQVYNHLNSSFLKKQIKIKSR